MKQAEGKLIAVCRTILEERGIEPWPYRQEHPRALQWLMPMELVEDIEREDGIELQMFGYPVRLEMLLGEHTIALMETIAIEQVRG